MILDLTSCSYIYIFKPYSLKRHHCVFNYSENKFVWHFTSFSSLNKSVAFIQLYICESLLLLTHANSDDSEKSSIPALTSDFFFTLTKKIVCFTALGASQPRRFLSSQFNQSSAENVTLNYVIL